MPATSGRWRKPRSSISTTASDTRVSGGTQIGLGVMTSRAVVCSGSRPAGQHARHQVALGQDAQQGLGRLDDEHAAAVGARHRARGFAHAGTRRPG